MDGMQLITATHATGWQDALPLGDGATGVLWWGNVQHDRLDICHAGCWLPHRDRRRTPPGTASLVHEIRELILAGQPDRAERLWLERCRAAGLPYVGTDSPHPAAGLRIDLLTPCEVTGYRRHIDADCGVAGVRWMDGANGEWRRQVFVDRISGIGYVRLQPPQGGRLSVRVTIDDVAMTNARLWQATTYPPLDEAGWKGSRIRVADLVQIQARREGRLLLLRGTYTHGPGGWAVAVLLHSSADAAPDDPLACTVHDAERCDLTFAVHADPYAHVDEQMLADRLQTTADRDVAIQRHSAAHRAIFCRASFGLTDHRAQAAPTPPTNEALLARAADGETPAALWRRLWAMGRHLLISSTRADGHWPPHLQGIWTGTWDPPWFGCYVNDENVQMMHWQTVTGRLADQLAPLRRLIRDSRDHWARNATDLFGCSGLLAPLQQGGAWAYHDQAEWHGWTGGAGWLALHVWDAWAVDRDSAILREELLPLLLGVAEFYRDFLVSGDDGLLHVIPSISVENHPRGWPGRWTIDATMDLAIIRAVLTRLIDALQSTGTGDPEHWQAMLRRLPAYRINDAGELAEWADPRFQDRHEHRHISHLFPLFPGDEWLGASDDLTEAARRAVQARQRIGQNAQTGWSYAHLAHFYARLGDGQGVQQCLRRLLIACVQPNLLTNHNDWRCQGLTMGPYQPRPRDKLQLDAIYGAASAIQEALVQSGTDCVVLAPAILPDWPAGHFRGAGTRCGLIVDLAWSPDGHCQTDLHAARDTTVTAVLGPPAQAQRRQLNLKAGQHLHLEWDQPGNRCPRTTNDFVENRR